MAAIDSILAIMMQQGADELRLGTDRNPGIFARGVQKKLSIGETSDLMLRHLLGPILSPEREEKLRTTGKIECTYHCPQNGEFSVLMTVRPSAAKSFDATMLIDVVMHALAASKHVAVEAPEPIENYRSPDPPRELHEESAEPVEHHSSMRAATMSDPGSSLAHLLSAASACGASDLHLQTGEIPSVRVNGRLRALQDEGPCDVEALLAGCLPHEKIETVMSGRASDLGIQVATVGRVRLNVYRAAGMLCAAARLLRPSAPSLRELNFPMPLDDLADLPNGLIILCGPTGSGKSATLAALAQHALNRRSVMLLTLEDPVEYLFRQGTQGSLVRQRQVGQDVSDFPSGLRDALREDPDLILLGEMRDPDTIGLGLTAAETGHFVLTSLHSRTAAGAIDRIVDSYPPERQQQVRVQLADCLRAVIAQKLIPTYDGHSRIPALDVLRVTHSVASLIREGKTQQILSAQQSGRREGMLPLDRCLADLVKSNSVRLEDARAVANDMESFLTYLRG